jgi:outer membrane immunogenic protein
MKFIVAVLAGLFGATSALAADLPAPIYTKAPVYVDPGYNWTGFYLGGLPAITAPTSPTTCYGSA